MTFGKTLAAVASLGLLTAPLQAAETNGVRAGSAVEGEELAGGLSDSVLVLGLVVAIGALVAVAADDGGRDFDEDFPVSP